jgi:hypothetical protein
MRLSRDQKRRKKLGARKAPRPVISTPSPTRMKDFFGPRIIASLSPAFVDCGIELGVEPCCVTYLGERTDGKRVIQVYGEPCPGCWETMRAICHEGIADSVFFADDVSSDFVW